MSWKKEVFEKFKLYAVTDLNGKVPGDILPRTESLCRGGVDIIQLRTKNITDAEVLSLALKMREVTEKHRKLFFVNDRPDLALLSGADGVHVGQDDLPVSSVREIMRGGNREYWVGKSTHEISQSVSAQEEGADYIGVGPVFATPTKPDYRPAGLTFVSQASRTIRIPFVCIGGIDLTNVEEVLSAGASRIAAVRALFSSEDVYESAQKFRNKIESFSHA